MYLTDKRVAVLGAAGAIGSNIVQTLLATRTTGNVSMYDPIEGPLEGAAEEIYHSAFPGANVTWTSDISESLTGTDYIITAGGAPRKEGMTREDLRMSNAEIAKGLGLDIKKYTPDCKLVIVIFNPADITGLTTLVHSGLPSGRVTTLAALDSTRLQTALAQHFKVSQEKVKGTRTYGGHGEQMAVFKGGVSVDGIPLTKILEGEKVGGTGMTADEWKKVQDHVRDGGARVIKLRGRSSFQSPAQQSVFMLRAVLGGEDYEWPCGAYVNSETFAHIMMAMKVKIEGGEISWQMPQGDEEDMGALTESYKHLADLRDVTIADGILPPISEWPEHNPNL